MVEQTPAAPSAVEATAAVAAAGAVTEPVQTPVQVASTAADPAASKDAKTVAADPSAAEGAKPEPGMREKLLSVVKAAVEPPKVDAKAGGASPDPATTSQDPAAIAAKAEADKAAADKAAAEKAAAEEAEPPFHQHPAWQKKLTKIREQDAKIAELSTPAEQYGKVEAFMQATGLVPEEVATGFEVMALIKNKPIEARKILQTYIDQIDVATGEKLPDDLKAKVEAGSLDEPSAKELSLARARTAAAEGRATAVTTASSEARAQAEANAVGNACAAAVDSWERGIALRDPDYNRVKQPMVMDRVQAIVAADPTKRPRTPDDSVALAKQALRDVEARLAPLRPAPVATAPTTSTQAAPAAAASPRNLREAVMAGIGMSKAA